VHAEACAAGSAELRRAVARVLAGTRREEARHVLVRRGRAADLIEVAPGLRAAGTKLRLARERPFNRVRDLYSPRLGGLLLRRASTAWWRWSLQCVPLPAKHIQLLPYCKRHTMQEAHRAATSRRGRDSTATDCQTAASAGRRSTAGLAMCTGGVRRAGHGHPDLPWRAGSLNFGSLLLRSLFLKIGF
jgi:hypothetical protein